MRAWIKDVQKFRIMMSVVVLYVVTISLALLNRDTSWAPWFLIPLSLLHLYFLNLR